MKAAKKSPHELRLALAAAGAAFVLYVALAGFSFSPVAPALPDAATHVTPTLHISLPGDGRPAARPSGSARQRHVARFAPRTPGARHTGGLAGAAAGRHAPGGGAGQPGAATAAARPTGGPPVDATPTSSPAPPSGSVELVAPAADALVPPLPPLPPLVVPALPPQPPALGTPLP